MSSSARVVTRSNKLARPRRRKKVGRASDLEILVNEPSDHRYVSSASSFRFWCPVEQGQGSDGVKMSSIKYNIGYELQVHMQE